MQTSQAELQDLEGILEILNYEIKQSTSLYEYEPRSIQEQKKWFSEKKELGFPVFIVKEKNKILGFGTYGSFRPRPAYQYTVEHSVYVHHEYWGRGIGENLMIALIRHAKGHNFHTMIGLIDSSNKGSILFHKKLGFEVTGSLREVGYKFDSWLDLTIMELLLD